MNNLSIIGGKFCQTGQVTIGPKTMNETSVIELADAFGTTDVSVAQLIPGSCYHFRLSGEMTDGGESKIIHSVWLGPTELLKSIETTIDSAALTHMGAGNRYIRDD